jgi:hypothetical protein
MKYIKSIYEFETAFGDTYGYGGANGILKINYTQIYSIDCFRI